MRNTAFIISLATLFVAVSLQEVQAQSRNYYGYTPYQALKVN
jgi:MFS-type transporter involved in bile tolerance (Atg22 family)